jgi:dinuclear metal center YbgI/SA1388 family protein
MTNSTQLASLVSYLNEELRISDYSDIAINGLQIESSQGAISRIAFAVDAGMAVIEKAVERGCQLLVVHHGVFWGQATPVVGPWARKLELCLTRGLSLYACHLPLDGHPTLGNAAQLGLHLGAVSSQPGFPYKGAPIGVIADLSQPKPLDALASILGQCEGALTPPLVLPFGKSHAKKIGIATGAATSLIPEVVSLGLDVLITGEPKQEAYHSARDFGCSVICMGHYASETFGVRALERVLATKFRVETEWISEPTGI